MTEEPSPAHEAHAAFESGDYSLAEATYRRALQDAVPMEMSTVLSWFTARELDSVTFATALVARHPDSGPARRLLVAVLLKAKRYEQAIIEVTKAVAEFTPDRGLEVVLRHQRLVALIKASWRVAPDFQLLLDDARFLWAAYADAKKAEKLRFAIIRDLAQLQGAESSSALDYLADDLQDAHPQMAAVLRAHAATTALLARAEPASMSGRSAP